MGTAINTQQCEHRAQKVFSKVWKKNPSSEKVLKYKRSTETQYVLDGMGS